MTTRGRRARGGPWCSRSATPTRTLAASPRGWATTTRSRRAAPSSAAPPGASATADSSSTTSVSCSHQIDHLDYFVVRSSSPHTPRHDTGGRGRRDSLSIGSASKQPENDREKVISWWCLMVTAAGLCKWEARARACWTAGSISGKRKEREHQRSAGFHKLARIVVCGRARNCEPAFERHATSC
jgi:hypothetical protein